MNRDVTTTPVEETNKSDGQTKKEGVVEDLDKVFKTDRLLLSESRETAKRLLPQLPRDKLSDKEAEDLTANWDAYLGCCDQPGRPAAEFQNTDIMQVISFLLRPSTIASIPMRTWCSHGTGTCLRIKNG
jgi:hypothetical protein